MIALSGKNSIPPPILGYELHCSSKSDSSMNFICIASQSEVDQDEFIEWDGFHANDFLKNPDKRKFSWKLVPIAQELQWMSGKDCPIPNAIDEYELLINDGGNTYSCYAYTRCNYNDHTSETFWHFDDIDMFERCVSVKLDTEKLNKNFKWLLIKNINK